MHVALLLAVAPAHAWDDAPDLLFVGNSYTNFNQLDTLVEQSLPGLVPPLTAVRGERLAVGGARFASLLARIEGTDPAWVAAFDGSDEWDVVVFQDQSQIPGLDGVSPDFDLSYDAFPQLDGHAASTGAETVLFMTWGRRDGDGLFPDVYPDFETMNARIDEGYRAFAANPSTPGRPITIAPVGRAFGAVYDRLEAEGAVPEMAGSDFYRLYNPDGSHPSALGSGLAAGVFTATLSGYYPGVHDLERVHPDDAGWVVDAIAAAVVPFGDLHFPWAVDWADYAAPDNLDAWGEHTVVSGLLRCTTRGVTSSVGMVAKIAVGGSHGGVPGCGRLWVAQGGDAHLVDVIVGAAGSGEVRVSGGDVRLDGLTLGSDLATGELVVMGGAVEVTALSQVDGAVVVTGGSLALDAWDGLLRGDGGRIRVTSPASGAQLELHGGELELIVEDATPALALAEASVLGGTITVPSLSGDVEVVLVSAPSFTHEGLGVELPTGWVWSIADSGSEMTLVASPPADLGMAPPGVDPVDPRGSEAESGCGCATNDAPLGPLVWLLGVLGLAGWGRRT